MIVGAEEQFRIGQPDAGADNWLLASKASHQEFEVMFEDDGTTGYFYAIRSKPEPEILDALHVYNVADVADRNVPVTAQVLWDETEGAAALVLNGYCHALFDFRQLAGFCRNAFPPPMQAQSAPRELTDDLVDQYFSA
ncbi:DUF2251 domain-containing protein [Solirubrum puertoriconensis]|uniref:DUF2251 domain-containing protein n=1 Tax=Solirubrum puertoriconensis TaxID=1751427 RepID=A0A9X0L3B1_SOLP1|nr:DUF2251 domain-containing protein [Solirubrum puertoriconensis]KUG06335.1 hypothetical protein ASU33_02975 [Solirubrum puertoriconensis]